MVRLMIYRSALVALLRAPGRPLLVTFRRPKCRVLSIAATKSGSNGSTTMAKSQFDTYFAELWGPRWETLSPSLRRPTAHCALLNPFINDSLHLAVDVLNHVILASFSSAIRPIRALEYHWPPERNPLVPAAYPPPMPEPETGLMPWYWLDPASILPPLALDVRPGHRVLDMCAAPGGKSFILAQMLFGGIVKEEENKPHSGPGALVCNEIDAKRRARMLNVLRQYLPASTMSHIRVTGRDGTKWRAASSSEHYELIGSDEDAFDRILIDAPCSSDRHVAQQASSRGQGHSAVRSSEWTPQRCTALAKEQVKLVVAGVKSLAVGGRLVYSTCSIATVENDAVIEKVLEKAAGAVHTSSHGIVPTEGETGSQDDRSFEGSCGSLAFRDLKAFGAERTKHGWLILPDNHGWGPIYLSVLEKTRHTDMKRMKTNKYPKESARDVP